MLDFQFSEVGGAISLPFLIGGNMEIQNGDYHLYPQFFPVGARVRCELEWLPGKWRYGVVSHADSPRWIFIHLEDGTATEYDYRFLDVEDSRNSLVRLI